MLQIDFEGLCNANFLNYVTVAYQNHCYHWLEVEEREWGGGNRCNGSGGSQCACMVLIGEFSLVGSRAAIFLY